MSTSPLTNIYECQEKTDLNSPHVKAQYGKSIRYYRRNVIDIIALFCVKNSSLPLLKAEKRSM